MNAGGVPFYAINLAVGISLAIPGFQTDIAKGLLHALPQVCYCDAHCRHAHAVDQLSIHC